MPTTEYQRGYSKGYNTGKDRGDRAAQVAYEEAKRAAERAEMREQGMGIGHCEACRHWERPRGCAWGYCNVPRGAGTPWGTWAGPENNHDRDRIVTTPRFGCVLWLKSEQFK